MFCSLHLYLDLSELNLFGLDPKLNYNARYGVFGLIQNLQINDKDLSFEVTMVKDNINRIYRLFVVCGKKVYLLLNVIRR